MKSIYDQDDLRANATGLTLIYEGEKFFQEIMEKYPDYDPREIVGLFTGTFHGLTNRRILNLRQKGILAREPAPEVKPAKQKKKKSK
jgi:hypothetical protein